MGMRGMPFGQMGMMGMGGPMMGHPMMRGGPLMHPMGMPGPMGPMGMQVSCPVHGAACVVLAIIITEVQSRPECRGVP